MFGPDGYRGFRKRLKATPAWRSAKMLLKRATGEELSIRPEVTVDTERLFCWTICPSRLRRGAVVYSVGIADDLSFDEALLARHDVTIHGFDPTPFSAEWVARQQLSPQFHFHQWAVAGADGTLRLYPRVKRSGEKSAVMWTIVGGDEVAGDAIEVPAFTLTTIMARLGHARIDVLKMDVEGAEYGVIDSMLATQVRPVQLLVEFHHRFAEIGLEKTADALTKLRAAGYRVFAVADTGREVSFVRSELAG
jgi:FkbM family methyltransferase